MLTLIFTLRIPTSETLRDSRYTTCMDLVETQTRYVLTYFKSMESIPAQGPCPQLSMNEDSVKPEPLHNGFFCPPGLKLKTQTDNNVCCKCYTSRKQINQLTLASYTL